MKKGLFPPLFSQTETSSLAPTSELNLALPFGRASLVAQTVKCLPAMWETWVRSLGWEDPLEKEMANQLQYSCLENAMDRGVL